MGEREGGRMGEREEGRKRKREGGREGELTISHGNSIVTENLDDFRGGCLPVSF